MSPLPRLLAVLVLALSGLAVPVGASSAASSTAPSAAAAVPTAGQSTYTPVTPLRLLDTRQGSGPVGPGGTVVVPVVGRGGVPAGATAVVLGVTVLAGDRSTDVAVFPVSDLGASNVVAAARRTASNLVVSALSPSGSVTLRNAGGDVQLLVDLVGYHREGPGSSYVPATPARLLDTRTGRVPLGPREVRTLRVAGVGGVPADATAVAVNLTAVNASSTTDVRAYPAGPGPAPVVSSTNPGVGRPTAVAAVVAVGADGAISLRNEAGRVDLLVDLQGWYVPGEASVFHPLPPRRLLDTRTARAPVVAGAPRDLLVAGPGDVPAQATGVVLSVTALGATEGTDVRVYPVPADGASVPGTSTLNPGPGALLANTVLAAVGRDGSVRLRNARGSVHLLVDVTGWYGPTGRGWDVSWPQCTTAGATTSRVPTGGAFAVVGLNRRVPFTDNECFASEWAWASSLPGEPTVYVNLNAPGADSPQWTAPGPLACSGLSSDSGCAANYGRAAAAYAAARLPRTPKGGLPFVWIDIENGPVWQSGTTNPNAVAVNRAVLNGYAAGLRDAGLAGRYGLYVDAAAPRDNDWVQIMGGYTLPDLPVWSFRAPTADPRPLCVPAGTSVTRGPVQMVQVQPAQSGEVFDVDDLC